MSLMVSVDVKHHVYLLTSPVLNLSWEVASVLEIPVYNYVTREYKAEAR